MTLPEIILVVLVNCWFGPIDPPEPWMFPVIWIGVILVMLAQTRARP